MSRTQWGSARLSSKAMNSSKRTLKIAFQALSLPTLKLQVCGSVALDQRISIRSCRFSLQDSQVSRQVVHSECLADPAASKGQAGPSPSAGSQRRGQRCRQESQMQVTRCAAVLGTVSSRTPKRRSGQSRSRHGEPRGSGPVGLDVQGAQGGLSGFRVRSAQMAWSRVDRLKSCSRRCAGPPLWNSASGAR